jgi:hypothetical protein
MPIEATSLSNWMILAVNTNLLAREAWCINSQSRKYLPRPIQGSIAKSNLKWIHTRKVSLSKCMRESLNHHLSSIFRSSNNIFNEQWTVLYWLHGTCKNSKEKVPQATYRDTQTVPSKEENLGEHNHEKLWNHLDNFPTLHFEDFILVIRTIAASIPKVYI